MAQPPGITLMTKLAFDQKAAQQDAVLKGAADDVKALKVLGGLNPGNVSDATVANLATNRDTRFSGVLADMFARTQESLYAKSAVVADFVGGDYRMENIRQMDRATVVNTAGSSFSANGGLRAFQAGTNITPNLPFLSVIPGLVASGSPGRMPTNWFGHNNSQPKTVVAGTADSFTMSIAPVNGHIAAGLRSDIFTPGADVLLSFNMDLTHPSASTDARLEVGWFIGGALGTTVPVSTLNSGKHRVGVRLPNPGGPAQLTFIIITRGAGVGTDPITMTISEIMTTTTTHIRQGDAFVQPPYIIGSWPAPTATLAAPADGEYVLLASTTERGIVARNASVVNKSLNIAAALDGSYTVEKVLLIPRVDYLPGDSEFLAPPQFVNIPRYSNAGRVLRDKALGVLQTSAISAGNSTLVDHRTHYAAQVAQNALHRTRFEIRNGDRMAEDGASQRRAELEVGGALPFDVPVSISFWFRVLQPSVSADAYALLFQCRYTNDPGDTSALSPELSLVEYPGNKVQLITRSSPTNGGSAQTNPPLVSGSLPNLSTVSPSTVVRAEFKFTPGKWHRCVVMPTFSKSGGGYLKAWFDGESAYDAPAAIGYNRAQGPQFHHGAYGGNHPETREVEFANVECGIADLSSRVTSPLPV